MAKKNFFVLSLLVVGAMLFTACAPQTVVETVEVEKVVEKTVEVEKVVEVVETVEVEKVVEVPATEEPVEVMRVGYVTDTGGIDDKRYTRFVRETRDRFDVRDIQTGVPYGFDINALRFLVDRPSVRLYIQRIHQSRGDTELRKNIVEHRVRAAVQIVRGNELVSLFQDVDESGKDGTGSRCKGEGADTAFEPRHPLFNDIRGGIHQPRVDVPRLLQ